MPQKAKRAPVSRPASHKPNPDRTRKNILAVARREFAEHGLSGGRIDAIAAQMRTTKRMIYYYFGSKEGATRRSWSKPMRISATSRWNSNWIASARRDAVRRLIAFTFDYEESHPDFIRLVAIENIHNGEHLARSEMLRQQNATVIKTLGKILARGRRAGMFRADVTAIDLHFMISAFCFFRVSNRHTFGALFNCDLAAPGVRARHKRLISDAVLRMLEPR